ncbi:hypothetical protein AVEN_151137-1 [Araneus ventricosus]|uniref:Uncharacterized protein n=1 Tax=Araneus ventricosus TaxID=182803 RepID=A0A4Y1ZU99_ARAVE|nr:hypothetical protein AVEN_151137-1 [Araneus ventricosus]
MCHCNTCKKSDEKNLCLCKRQQVYMRRWDPPQLPMSAKRSGNSRQPIGFLQASVRVQAPTVLYTLLMECCRPVSNRSTGIGVRARGLRKNSTVKVFVQA